MPGLRAPTRPPRLAPLIGRASPMGSKNFGGVGKGVDMPNKTAGAGAMGGGGMGIMPSPAFGASNAPYKHEMPTSFGPNRDYMK